MAYQTLYRKYRPNSFDLVFGQDVIVKTLKNIIKNNKLSHAYLFTGPRGTGKTSSAKLFAKAVNCLNNVDGDACNKCDNCEVFNKNGNPDIIEIDAASNNGVDEIREIRNKVNLVPSISKYKVYIIDEVHMLSIGAFNALLKTLEEPPEHIIFILATTEPQKIPATIISRCQRYDFKNISHDNMKKCLENIIKNEKISIEENALDEIIYNSNGGMRDAIGMLDQAFAFCDGTITKNDIENLSGSISDSDAYEYIKKLIDNDINYILKYNDKISNEGKDIEIILLKILNVLRKELIDTKLGKANKLQCSDTKLIEIIDNVEKTVEKVAKTSNKKIIFDVEIIKMFDNSVVDVPRETLIDDNIIKEDNVSRETLKENNNEPNENEITNVLVRATKPELNSIKEKWSQINEYLLDDKFKLEAGLLINCVPVAASEETILISTDDEPAIKRINQNIEQIKILIEKILDTKRDLVCISSDFWKEKRPIYAKQIKNKELKYIKIEKKQENTNEILKDFDEFIEIKED